MIEPEPTETALSLDQTAGGEFLSLDELGKVLTQLASQGLILAFDILKSFIIFTCENLGSVEMGGNNFPA